MSQELNSNPAYPILDGFVLQSRFRPDFTYLAYVTQGYEAMRRARRYRTRWLMIPTDPRTTVPPNDDYKLQASATPGSIYWALMSIINPGAATVGPAPALSYQITDGCTEITVFTEPVGSGIPNNNNYPRNPGQGYQLPFAYPLVVAPPGIISVSISTMNRATPATGLQVVLVGAQPISEEEA